MGVGKVVWLWVLCLSLYLQQPTILAAQSEEAALSDNPRYSEAVARGLNASEAFTEEEQELRTVNLLESPEWYRFGRLPYIAKAALEAGENAKARQYADEALLFMNSHPLPNLADDALSAAERFKRMQLATCQFYCNLVLGRLSVLSGDIDRAGEYLLVSGKTEGNGMLHTFGPNMSLARELLKKGQRGVVLAFFEECRSFWKPEYGLEKLDKWATEVKAGGIPAFGVNLYD